MTNGAVLPHTVGSFLRHLRNTIKPHEVGIQIDPHKPRKVTGLLREEIANLAGISEEWYKKIEQGKQHLSLRTLNRLADSLGLDLATKSLLLGLAEFNADSPTHHNTAMFEHIQTLLDAQAERPAYVTDETWDILMWNQSTCAVFADYNHIKPKDRNILCSLFQSPVVTQLGEAYPRPFNEIMDHCDLHARNVISLAKVDYMQHPTPRLANVVSDLLHCNAYFRECWHNPELETNPHIAKTIHHGLIGSMVLQQIVLQVAQYPTMRVVTYVGKDEADHQKLLDLQYHVQELKLEKQI